MTNLLKFLVLLGFSLVAYANVTVSVPFGNHMVLQRNQDIPIWGNAASGESVTVTLNGQSRSATAASNGSWRIVLPAMSAGGPFSMTIKGNNTVTLTDVMVGEVWQCAGQSNMDTRMNYYEYPNLADSIKAANYPLMRYITMRQPGQTIQWQNVTPSTVGSLSATGYFFGRELLASLNGIAVGLVVTAVGGTVVEQWIDPATLVTMPELASDTTAGTMYNAWVKPVQGYAMRGTVWLQGENNTRSSNYATYGVRLAKMIPGWRKAWGQLDMPFIVAGLCMKGGLQTTAGEVSNQASIRESQRLVTDTLSNSWLSVLVDLGSETTWHYPQKPQAGFRLGRLARGAVYKHTGFTYEHPRPTACFRRGNSIVIPFDTRGSRLKLSSGTVPTGFAIAGSNNAWSWATASLVGDTIFLSTSIATPTQVKFAWANQPIMNLWSVANLPATPFHLTIASAPPVSSSAPLSSSSTTLSSSIMVSSSSVTPDNCPSCVVKIQAENPCVLEGFIESTHMGFEGTGYWNFNNALNSAGSWVLQSSITQNVMLMVRYANGGANARSMNVKMNGVQQASTLNFAPTGAWTNWQMDSISIHLTSGRDSIVFVSTTAEGGPNLDYLGFKLSGLQAINCEAPVGIKEVRIRENPQFHWFNIQGSRMTRSVSENPMPLIRVIAP